MNKENAIKEYLKQIPEIEKLFLEKCENSLIDPSDGAHVIWSLGLTPCVIDLIKELKRDQDILTRSFAFFEKMASSEEEVKELLLYSVLEQLGDDKNILNTSMKLMGKDTLMYSKQIENFLGR